MSKLTIEFEGEVYDPNSSVWDDLPEMGMPLDPTMRDLRDRMYREGVLLLDGAPLSGLAERRVRSRLLGTYANLVPVEGFRIHTQRARRFLIPGLWPWGHIPMLGGPPKVGKTTLVADLAASLLVPGRHFLDHFDAADLSQDANHGGDGLWVYVVNAETPAEDFEGALRAAGVRDDGWLSIEHLETNWGGATAFDLTVPEIYDLWLDRLVICSECDGSDFAPPSVLIVDGLTAILRGDTTRYGEWYAAFRRLMREAGIPNAIVTAHNGLNGRHLMNGVESMAQADGLWNYFSDDPDNPAAKRYFQVTPRIGGLAVPKTRVRVEGGRLRLNTAQPADAASADQPAATSGNEARDRLLAKLTEVGSAGIQTTALTGRGRVGILYRAELDRLRGEGRVTSQPDGQGQRWFLASDPPAA